jgi:hypothetical protein
VSIIVSRNVKNDHLQEIFGLYGNIRGIDLKTDRRNHLSKGEATITFSTEKDAEHALFHLDGGQIDGNIIKCSFVLVNPPLTLSSSSSSFSTSFPQKSTPVWDDDVAGTDKKASQDHDGKAGSRDPTLQTRREESNRLVNQHDTTKRDEGTDLKKDNKEADRSENKSKETTMFKADGRQEFNKGRRSGDDRDNRRSSRDRVQAYQPQVSRARSRSNPRAVTGRGSGRGGNRFPPSSKYVFDYLSFIADFIVSLLSFSFFLLVSLVFLFPCFTLFLPLSLSFSLFLSLFFFLFLPLFSRYTPKDRGDYYSDQPPPSTSGTSDIRRSRSRDRIDNNDNDRRISSPSRGQQPASSSSSSSAYPRNDPPPSSLSRFNSRDSRDRGGRGGAPASSSYYRGSSRDRYGPGNSGGGRGRGRYGDNGRGAGGGNGGRGRGYGAGRGRSRSPVGKRGDRSRSRSNSYKRNDRRNRRSSSSSRSRSPYSSRSSSHSRRKGRGRRSPSSSYDRKERRSSSRSTASSRSSYSRRSRSPSRSSSPVRSPRERSPSPPKEENSKNIDDSASASISNIDGAQT